MKIAYPLTSQKDYTELKYSLRSVERYLSRSEVLIIGETLPDWITNVTWIRLPDVSGRKQISVRRKIYAALEYANEVLFMNDDIYFLKTINPPYYFNGDLKKYTFSGSAQLQKELKALGKPTKNFDLHYPIVFREDFKEVMENFSGDCLIRSAYCNYLEIEGEPIGDCKILQKPKEGTIENMVNTRPCLSTGTYSFTHCLPTLKNLFPHKSRFEK